MKIFVSYSHKDAGHFERVSNILHRLKRHKLVEEWYDRKIAPGQEWEEAIDEKLKTADVVLLLVSPDFVGSDYAYYREMQQALERHEQGEAVVIPIIVRPVDWEGEPFGKLQALPRDAKPVTEWSNRDTAWLDVARGIRKAVEEPRIRPVEQQSEGKTLDAIPSPDLKGKEERHRQYYQYVESIWADEQLNRSEVEWADARAKELGLSASDASAIEREVMRDTKETVLKRVASEQYRTAVGEAWTDKEVSISEARRLNALASELGLSMDTAATIEREVMRESVQAILNRQLEKEEERQHQLEVLYNRGQQHVDAGEWQQALDCLEDLQRIEPGYRETETLLIRVRQELATPPTARVPNLSGQAVSQARSALTRQKLTLGAQNEVASDTVAKGLVIQQSPEAGIAVETGSSVNVTVSSGMREVTPVTSGQGRWTRPLVSKPKNIRIPILLGLLFALVLGLSIFFWDRSTTPLPNLQGLTIDQAAEKAGSNFQIYVRDVRGSPSPKGTVIDQKSGFRGRTHSAIYLTISAGDWETTKVPAVSGADRAIAGDLFIQAGLDPDFDVRFDPSGNPVGPSGTIDTTDPPVGSSVEAGREIITN